MVLKISLALCSLFLMIAHNEVYAQNLAKLRTDNPSIDYNDYLNADIADRVVGYDIVSESKTVPVLVQFNTQKYQYSNNICFRDTFLTYLKVNPAKSKVGQPAIRYTEASFSPECKISPNANFVRVLPSGTDQASALEALDAYSLALKIAGGKNQNPFCMKENIPTSCNARMVKYPPIFSADRLMSIIAKGDGRVDLLFKISQTSPFVASVLVKRLKSGGYTFTVSQSAAAPF